MNYTRNEKALKQLGKHLKSLREKQGYSLRGLADVAGVDFSQIHRIEKGESNPTYSMLLAICDALEMELHKALAGMKKK
jgi:transcriptional regulator with XRE-family HTH domain